MTPAESPLTPLDRSPDNASIEGTIEICRSMVFDGEPDGSGDYGQACSNRKVIELCESVLALRARLATVTQERERLHGERVELIRRFGVASQRRFIPEERITDADVVEHAIVTSAVELQGLRAEVAALKAEHAALTRALRATRPLYTGWTFEDDTTTREFREKAELAIAALSLPLAAAVPDEGGPTT